MRLLGLLFALGALVPAFACSSFGSSDPAPGPPVETDAQVDAPPGSSDAAATDAAILDVRVPTQCTAEFFCDDFERDELRGDWEYAPGTALGDSRLEIAPSTAASGSKSIVATTGKGSSLRVNALEHKFELPALLPFRVVFALKLAALPAADVRIVQVSFDSGATISVVLRPRGLAIWKEEITGGAVSAGGNPAETPPLDAWSYHELTIEAAQATLARINGVNSAASVPYADYGAARRVSIGMPKVDPSSTSVSFWIDDVMMPR